MGRRGPAPTPTAMLKLAGESGNFRSTDVPIPPGCPVPPKWLDGRALEVWRETVAILGTVPGLLTPVDASPLAAACVAQAQVEALYASVQATGIDPEGRNFTLKALREWIEASSRLWAKFGCTPADRVRRREAGKEQGTNAPSGLAKFAKHA